MAQTLVLEKFRKFQKSGVKHADVLDVYKKWASTYDKDLDLIKHDSARAGASALADELQRLQKPKNIRILDVAAGTGYCGVELKQRGFTNIDALDACQEMLNVAGSKDVYQSLICEDVVDKPLQIENDTYDALLCVEGFIDGHIKCDALPHLLKVVKPGGTVVLTVREEFLHITAEYRKLDPLIVRLREEGLWEYVIRYITPHYFGDKDGVIYVYRRK
ncbi:methyltransferase-like protein 27 [Branchiostoma floridae]|uniref:Methyltransferase-like protein 27 n=1 Tax=Branchiostoma floridae TaxID=7739 RepID=A0A9J7KHQ7_BRAFL|nr:methyltransferase-like protein 27 [Branchiostoma floridae]XP_035663814.1 methyltransferase-like protein 27 [Branchiostoma floridae]